MWAVFVNTLFEYIFTFTEKNMRIRTKKSTHMFFTQTHLLLTFSPFPLLFATHSIICLSIYLHTHSWFFLNQLLRVCCKYHSPFNHKYFTILLHILIPLSISLNLTFICYFNITYSLHFIYGIFHIPIVAINCPLQHFCSDDYWLGNLRGSGFISELQVFLFVTRRWWWMP